MAMFGIEFTSRFTEFLFFAMLLAIIVGAIWFVYRLRQGTSLLAVIRRENSKLRNEIANITGWTIDGRLPDDWQEKLHNNHALIASPILSTSEPTSDPVLLVAHHALKTIDPPYFATNDSDDAMEREHKRIVDVLEGLAHGTVDPETALANGDFDKLICMWRRLGIYFPDETETFVYEIAANAVLGVLKKHAIQVIAPRPLSVASAKSCILTTGDGEGLRDLTRIRAAALSTGAHLTTLQPGEEIVIDCQRPGWNGPNGQVNPRILILDKSW
jgi:hypothetical protein